MNFINKFRSDESGATAIEYGMIAGLIAVVIIGAVALLGPQLLAVFTSINTELTGAGITPAAGG